MQVVEVMYNACYGGFGFSELAVEEYRMVNPDKKYSSRSLADIDRADPAMVDIVKRLGAGASGQCGDIRIAEVPLKYAQHYRIGEYDGYERVYVDYNAYKLDAIRAVLDDESVQDKSTLADWIRGILDEDRSDETDTDSRVTVLAEQEPPEEV